VLGEQVLGSRNSYVVTATRQLSHRGVETKAPVHD
jgi:hypothetical protein